MSDSATLSSLAEAELAGLRADGIEPTDEQIVKLNALAWLVEDPQSRQELARGIPVEVAGVYLWPLSLYAQDWYSRVGARFKSETLCAYALAYAMAFQREDGEPLAFEGKTAEKAIRKWARSLRCTYSELVVAVSRVLAQEEEPEVAPTDTGGMTRGDFSAFLASACGGSPDFWERRCSAGYTYAVLDAMVRQNAADGKPSSEDARIKADAALGWAVEKIRREHDQA